MPVATLPDLLRLVAVPVLAWAAWRDVQVRRVPNGVWLPLGALGVALLAWEARAVGVLAGPLDLAGRLYVLRVALSLGVVVPLAYVAWRLRAFGGADAKALMVLAVLFPTAPLYVLSLGADPLVFPRFVGVGVFSLTVLTNTVLVAAAYPLLLTLRNAAAGEVDLRMFVGARVPAPSVTRRHGRLLETPDGPTRRGLDIDALRMYLRWRGATLAALRADPERHRDPASLPAEPNDPTDGAVAAGGDGLATDGGSTGRPAEGAAEPSTAGSGSAEGATEAATDDPWGADAFLSDAGDAWGTTAGDLRDGLEVLATRERVWYSPGIPFVVPMAVGLVVGLTAGDVLFAALAWLGLV